MTTADYVLDQARQLGVGLEANGPKLRVFVPEDIAEDDWSTLQAELLTHKPAILRLLAPPHTPWHELSLQRWGPSVNDPTSGIIIDHPDPDRLAAALSTLDPNQPGDAWEPAWLDDPTASVSWSDVQKTVAEAAEWNEVLRTGTHKPGTTYR